MADLAQFQQIIGVTFNNPGLLDLALTHSSYINENPGMAPVSNERLEFLGDSALGLIIAEKLYCDYPAATEGDLTRLRSALVRQEMLAHVAQNINLGSYLHLGRGEESGGGRQKTANLSGAFEALVAAIYLDAGFEVVRHFVLELFEPEIHAQARLGAGNDFKSRLQEIVQAERQITPSYHLIKAVGPDHAKEFTVEVKIGNTTLGRGTGNSKKTAEIEAARRALESLSES